MSTIFLLFLVTWWDGALPYPTSESKVTVTNYRRVTPSLQLKFYKELGTSGLKRAKVIPNAIPISYVHYKVIHPRRSQGVEGSPLNNPQIGSRIKRPLTNSVQKVRMTKDPFVGFPNSDYVINSGVGKEEGSTTGRPHDLSPILFPNEDTPFLTELPWRHPSKPITTTIDPSIITFEYEDHDKALTEEFLAWVKNSVTSEGDEINVRKEVSNSQETSSFALLNSGSLRSKCKSGYRMDQNGNCRKLFG